MNRKQLIIQYVSLGMLVLCVFANPIASFFKWTDELICLGVCLGGAVLWLRKEELRKQIPKHLLYFIPLFIYMFMQLLGSLIFQYQPWSAVIIDALTNAKFWLTLYGCYLISRFLPGEAADKGLLIGAKAMSAMLFGMFILERLGLVFTNGILTYGARDIPCAQVMYEHPSYFVAALVFLLAVLLAQWDKKLVPYVLADLVMMVFTFRSKAFGGVVVFLGLFVIVVLWKKKLQLWQIALTGAAVIAAAWEKIYFYFVLDKNVSPRPVLIRIGLKIMQDYFPLGTGFATFASNQAGVNYSPVYYLYGLDTHPFMGVTQRRFMDDTFWPIVFAQSGAIGLAAFLSVLLILVIKIWKLYDHDRKVYAAALFVLGYCLLASIAEPIFNNQTSVPLALLLGYWLGQQNTIKQGNLLRSSL